MGYVFDTDMSDGVFGVLSDRLAPKGYAYLLIHRGRGTIGALRTGRAGAPKLLALHGWLDNAASFLPLLPYLGEFELVALDLPGHGGSEGPALSGIPAMAAPCFSAPRMTSSMISVVTKGRTASCTRMISPAAADTAAGQEAAADEGGRVEQAFLTQRFFKRRERHTGTDGAYQLLGNLISRGKLPKVPLVAALRKLLGAVFAVVRDRKPFMPRLGPAAA